MGSARHGLGWDSIRAHGAALACFFAAVLCLSAFPPARGDGPQGGDGSAAREVAAPAVAGRRYRVEPFTFVHLSDTHFDTGQEPAWVRPSRAVLERGIDFLNESVRPDFVILTGDLISFEKKEQLLAVKDLLDHRLKCPYRPVLGNHDGEHWSEVFGEPTYAFSHKGVRFLALGLSYWEHDAGLGEFRGLDWLRGDLAEHRDEPAFVLTHNPVVPGSFSNAAAVQRLCEEAPNAVAVLGGHLHRDLKFAIQGVFHLTAPMFLRPPHRMRIFRVDADGAEVRDCDWREEGGYAVAEKGFRVGWR